MSGHSTYVPKSGFEKWLDSRLPILRFADDTVLSFPTPKNLNYWWTFGGILSFMLVIMIVSGIVLAMHYVANTELAFASVQHIMRDVNFGWLVRYIHANGASMFFLAVYIHMFRGLYYGSFKAPREVLWILGCLIFLLMMATAFLGYTLPWGQMSFWGSTVITNLFSAIPLVGKAIQTWLWGGFSVDQPTLNRFFSLHYLLPFVIAGVVALHIWALHVPGNNNPLGINVKGPQDTLPFHPYYTTKDTFAISVFLLFYMGIVFFAPEFFGNSDNAIPANPLVTPTHIVPEWYLLPFYAILRSITFNFLGIDAKLLGVLAMFGSIFVLFLLPWLDGSRVRSGRFRPLFQLFFWILVVAVLGLGWVGSQRPDTPLFKIGTDNAGIASDLRTQAETAGLTDVAASLKGKKADTSDNALRTAAAKIGLGDEAYAKIVAAHPKNFAAVGLGQLLTAYYFLFFLIILPVLGIIETPLPVPESISKPVLPQGGGAAAAAAQAPA